MSTFTISQLSQQVGLPPKTIRFYEQEGLIAAPERGENGYRNYSQKAVKELKLIKFARDLGLPISEMKKLMKGCDESGNCEHTKTHVISSLDSYLLLVGQKLEQFTLLKTKLKKLRDSLASKPDDCDTDGYCCNYLSQLMEIE
jgi:MerR family copper efflux transcriptional regulator